MGNIEIPRLAPHALREGGPKSHRHLHATVSIPVGPPPVAVQEQPVVVAAQQPSQPMTLAPTNVSIAPTRSVRESPPARMSVAQAQPAPMMTRPESGHIPHHTHRFPHSASETSQSFPRSVGPAVGLGQPQTLYHDSSQPHIHVLDHTTPAAQYAHNHQAAAPQATYDGVEGVTTVVGAPGPVIVYPAHQQQAQPYLAEQEYAMPSPPPAEQHRQSSQPRSFSDIRPVPIIDYKSFMDSKRSHMATPPLVMMADSVPILEPQPQPVQHDIEANLDNGQEQVHYRAHVGTPTVLAHRSLHGSHEPTLLQAPPLSRHGSHSHHDHHSHHHRHPGSPPPQPDYYDALAQTPVEPSHTPHHHKHHHHRKFKKDSGSRPDMDRHGSGARSEVYVKQDETPIAADRVGKYAYPPDTETRLAREMEARQKEVERVAARAKGGNWPGMLPTGGYLAMGPAMYGRPPPLGAFPPLNPMMAGMMRPPMMNPIMGPMGMIGGPMGMGMGMMGGPMGMMQGIRNFNALPGRFGRDMLGRDFAGPGGIGHSIPYRPPDPSVPHPLPQGLPIVARPPREGFDAYGRRLPPPLPEGVDGWGRILPVIPDGHPWKPWGFGPGPAPPLPPPVVEGPPAMVAAGGGMPSNEDPNTRPGEPACFLRPPIQGDLFPYADFQPFTFKATRLAHPSRLRRPQELASHDVDISDWETFIESLSAEAYRHAHRGSDDGSSFDDRPQLTPDVHELLRAWQVGFFGPRAIKVLPTRKGKTVFDPGFGVHKSKAALEYRRAAPTDYTDDMSRIDSENDDGPVLEAKYSARERKYRRDLRALEKKTRDLADTMKDRNATRDWDITFCYAEPVLWRPSQKARRYGEKIKFERPKY